MVGRFLALLALSATFVAVTSLPLLRHDKDVHAEPSLRMLPEEDDNEVTPNEHEEDEPNTSNKGVKDKASTAETIPDKQYTRRMCPSGYVTADRYESFYCANITSGYTWRDCCVLDPDTR